jgi:hypothetical protein
MHSVVLPVYDMRYNGAVAHRASNEIAAEHQHMGGVLDAIQFAKDVTS